MASNPLSSSSNPPYTPQDVLPFFYSRLLNPLFSAFSSFLSPSLQTYTGMEGRGEGLKGRGVPPQQPSSRLHIGRAARGLKPHLFTSSLRHLQASLRYFTASEARRGVSGVRRCYRPCCGADKAIIRCPVFPPPHHALAPRRTGRRTPERIAWLPQAFMEGRRGAPFALTPAWHCGSLVPGVGSAKSGGVTRLETPKLPASCGRRAAAQENSGEVSLVC